MTHQETVFITGASAGIGEELARRFAMDGCDLVLTARHGDKLRQLATELKTKHGNQVTVLPCDLANSGAAGHLKQQIDAQEVQIDVLVNNAGFGAAGKFAELSLERQMAMIQLNVTSLAELSRLFLPGMLRRRRGGILNVASTAAFQPGPNMATYYATKAFVLSLTEALYQECRGTGVHVCCLAPGPTKTFFGSDSGAEDSLVFRLGTMSAAAVAQAAHAGYRQQKRLVMPGWKNWFGAFLVRVGPRSLVLKIIDHIQRVSPGSS